MKDDAPGVERVSRAGENRARQDYHQRHLDGAGKRLPPDEHLAKHDPATRISHPVLGQELDERCAGAHVEEEPCHVEKLRDATPDAQRLRRREYVHRQDQVLVDNQRDEEHQAQQQRQQESAQRSMKADRFPFRAGLARRVFLAVNHHRVECLRMTQTVPSHQHEGDGCGRQHQPEQAEQQRPITGVRHRRGRIAAKESGVSPAARATR